MANGLTAVTHSAFLVHTVNYMTVASFTILVADYLQTLELEVELIWNANWGLIKWLFLFSRYSAFFDVPLMLYYSLAPHLTNHECSVIFHIVFWSMFSGVQIAEAILFVRTYAILGNTRKALIYLSTQFVVFCISIIVVLNSFLNSLRYGPAPLPALAGCSLVKSNKLFVGVFALQTLCESALMLLTVWIGVTQYRHSRNALVVTLYRDGIFFFFYLSLISGANIVVLIIGPPELTDLISTFHRVMHSILSTRIVLHVRNTYRDRDAAFLVSDLRFGATAN